jgi:hypothetical protein
MTKRAIIVGTAPSWKKAPWHDLDCTIVGLNDAYALNLPRIDEWYELHPFDAMWFKPSAQKVVHAKDIPKGAYIRPEGHLQWLRQQATAIPVWLQKEPPADWPVNAARLPIEQIEAEFGQYWASGPAYEIAHLYLRGYRSFEIYGIHLSTEAEYRDQRPQLEMLLGRLLGTKVTESRDEARGLRIYQGAEVRIVLPVESPILQHGWKYAYERKPTAPHNPYADELARTQKQKNALVKALVHCPVGQDKSPMLAELEDLEVIELDCQQMIQRSHGCGTLTAVLTQ